MITGASERIRHAMSLLDGVTELHHRFGGIEFRLGKRELGHIHGDSLLDIPLPTNKFKPTGGVIIPTSMFTIMMTPK